MHTIETFLEKLAKVDGADEILLNAPPRFDKQVAEVMANGGVYRCCQTDGVSDLWTAEIIETTDEPSIRTRVTKHSENGNVLVAIFIIDPEGVRQVEATVQDNIS